MSLRPMPVVWHLLLLCGLAASTTSAPVRADSVAEWLAACFDQEDVDPEQSIALAERVLASSSLQPSQRAQALACRGWSSLGVGQYDAAQRDARELRGLLAQIDDAAERVRMTRRAGGILHRSDEPIAAVELYAQAVADAEANRLETERIPLLINLGVLHSEFEEHERAEVNYTQALLLMEQLDEPRHEAPVRYNLGLNLAGQERHAEAVPQLERVMSLLDEAGSAAPAQVLGVRMALANALQHSGQGVRARALVEQIRAMDVPLGDPDIRAQLAMIEASRLVETGQPAAALELLDGLDATDLPHIRHWSLLRQRARTLELLGRDVEMAQTWRDIAAMREAYLRSQNLERLATLEAHLRDREQQLELERLRLMGEEQKRRLAAGARMQTLLFVAALGLLCLGLAVSTWQRRMNRRLDRVSRTDALTGLANRRDMAERLRERTLRGGSDAAVLLIDIDLFKRINDRHGHAVGDAVLVHFARRVRASVNGEAVLARWGGEEFLVLIEHSSASAVRALAERLRRDLAGAIDTGHVSVPVTVSIGYANLPLPGASGADRWQYSLQLADDALYQAKGAGRDAWAGYWVESEVADWPAARLGSDAGSARAQGLLQLVASRATS